MILMVLNGWLLETKMVIWVDEKAINVLPRQWLKWGFEEERGGGSDC